MATSCGVFARVGELAYPTHGTLQHLNGRLHHVRGAIDVALGGGQVLVPGQGHDYLRADAAMGKPGYEPPPAAVAARPINTGFLVQMAEQLAEGVGREGRLLLRQEERGIGCRPLLVALHELGQLFPESLTHEDRSALVRLRRLRAKLDQFTDMAVAVNHVAPDQGCDLPNAHAAVVG